MKIENEGLRRLLSRYAEQAEATKPKEAREAQETREKADADADEVVVSDRARELQRAHQRLDEIAAARKARVEAISRDVETGAYKVSGDMVARKLLKQS
ncbi:MAG: flagellar biosynthesis anti-sigma factor FlgM [Firmicutes bacterium]|nr:flagellar biosynthesis anti-sigma factor FlgM [Bacillota bacterium]MDH7496655.1 flagellar biosynthesis anti-sigma factor FlgM [Bacillota bacterium]